MNNYRIITYERLDDKGRIDHKYFVQERIRLFGVPVGWRYIVKKFQRYYDTLEEAEACIRTMKHGTNITITEVE